MATTQETPHFYPDGQPISPQPSAELLGTLALVEGFSQRLKDPSASFGEVSTIHSQAEEIGQRYEDLRRAHEGTEVPAAQSEEATLRARLSDRSASIEELEQIRNQLYASQS